MEAFDLWDKESKVHNKERERLEYERYFEELRVELEVCHACQCTGARELVTLEVKSVG